MSQQVSLFHTYIQDVAQAPEQDSTVVTEPALAPESTCVYATLDVARAAAKACTACRLHEGRTNMVFSDGNPEAKIMFIGEGPGQQEDETGVPFVGRAGQLLTKIIESAGLSRAEDTYICNVVKCRPPGNREPQPDEALACADFLSAQIALVRPKIIVLVGKTAVKWVLKQQDVPISKMRGKWLDSPYPNTKMMAVFHPSYLLRNPSPNEGTPKWLTWQDMLEIKREWETLS